MLSLNLVSQELRNDLKLRRLYKILKRVDFVLIIFIIFIAVMMLVAKIMLQNNFNQVVEQTTRITKNSQSYNLKVREINAKINAVEQIQKDFIVWTDIYEELAALTNEDITFTGINLNGTNKTLKVGGLAKTRDGLMAFKDKLEKSEYFSKIDFPISNILEKANVNFQINAAINFP